jgi:hypothetical protein
VIVEWAQIASWHALRPDGKTLCGRSVNRTQAGNTRDELPGEKSCETCLRIVARKADVGVQPVTG